MPARFEPEVLLADEVQLGSLVPVTVRLTEHQFIYLSVQSLTHNSRLSSRPHRMPGLPLWSPLTLRPTSSYQVVLLPLDLHRLSCAGSSQPCVHYCCTPSVLCRASLKFTQAPQHLLSSAQSVCCARFFIVGGFALPTVRPSLSTSRLRGKLRTGRAPDCRARSRAFLGRRSFTFVPNEPSSRAVHWSISNPLRIGSDCALPDRLQPANFNA